MSAWTGLLSSSLTNFDSETVDDPYYSYGYGNSNSNSGSGKSQSSYGTSTPYGPTEEAGSGRKVGGVVDDIVGVAGINTSLFSDLGSMISGDKKTDAARRQHEALLSQKDARKTGEDILGMGRGKVNQEERNISMYKSMYPGMSAKLPGVAYGIATGEAPSDASSLMEARMRMKTAQPTDIIYADMQRQYRRLQAPKMIINTAALSIPLLLLSSSFKV